MSTIRCSYRIYPSWFVGRNNIERPMREMAEHAAAHMGRLVEKIEITDQGEDDDRGLYIDFSVTYSSTGMLMEAQ